MPHDTSNALVLPAKSKCNNSSSRKSDSKPKKPLLSKKKEKKLRKILEKKNKKISRSEVLQRLSEHQISQQELDLFSSVKKIQQKVPRKTLELSGESKFGIKTVAGSNKKRYCNNETVQNTKFKTTGPYFETDSSESESEIDQENFTTNNITTEENDPEVLDVKQDITESSEEQKSIIPVPDPIRRATVFVPVNRTSEIQESRLKLPILGMEQEIVETIHENDVTIICGATGSGKTTQVPQFLYEAGYCNPNKLIGITEPRRVAAVSMADRVGQEMGLGPDTVSYQIRYEGTSRQDSTKLKFMTDGVLLRELKKDFSLKRYSVVIIDEAHERSMYSDILIGLLSRVVRLRKKRNMDQLKLIVMSATLRVDDFLAPKLFGAKAPPVLNVESRQFPVTVHFNRRTRPDFLQESFKKCSQIHRKLPDGGILVFLPGQREVRALVARLKKSFGQKNKIIEPIEEEEFESNKNTGKKRKRIVENRKFKLDDYKIDINDVDVLESDVLECDELKVSESDDLNLRTDDEEEEMIEEEDIDASSNAQPMHVLPLYALLPAQDQSLVFQGAPENHRLCIVATNVAETSLTIPGIKYVVDCGREKTRIYDAVTGVSKFVTKWISQASAEQRTGRAGRTSPGHCYRLYSSAVYQDFEQFTVPEILSRPADDLVLVMKNMNIARVVNFPFPTAPLPEVLKAAEERLRKLGALDSEARITPLGRTMALFPVSPAYAKMLALGHQHNLMPYVVCLVAALSVREPMINLSAFSESTDSPCLDKEKLGHVIKNHLEVRKTLAGRGESFLLGDLSVLLSAVLEGEKRNFNVEFCSKNGFRPKAALEIRKMRRQLTNLINGLFPDSNLTFDPNLSLPDQNQSCALRQIILSGLAWNVARKMPDLPGDNSDNKPSIKNGYKCSNGIADWVFVHPSSVLRKTVPEFVVYQELLESSDKKFMINVTSVDRDWLVECARDYCSFGEPMDEPQPWYDQPLDSIMCQRECKFGAMGWNLGLKILPHPWENNLNFYKFFLIAFLRGEIFPELGRYSKLLLLKPESVLKSWAIKLQKERVEAILAPLVENEITSKKKCRAKFTENSKLLLDEYCLWLPESKHREVQLIWPPDD